MVASSGFGRRLPGSATGIQKTREWLRKRMPKSMQALHAYREFLSDADELFVVRGESPKKQSGMDRRFRTPGDMVDNDIQIVRRVPTYLGDLIGK